MPKRFNDRMRSIFVKFERGVTDKEINSELRSMGVSGSRVSTLINRWVVEVPFWKEQEYMERLAENELVETVHESGDSRRRTNYEEEVDEDE